MIIVFSASVFFEWIMKMKKTLSLTEYRSLAYTLHPIKPLGTCCSNVLLETIHVEPLESKLQARRKQNCIVQCPECKKMYVSKY